MHSPLQFFSSSLPFPRTSFKAMPAPESKTRVALLASPGMGHLIPVLELAKRMALHHNLETFVFLVGGTSSAAESEILRQASAGKSLTVVSLPSGGVEPNAPLVEKIKASMRVSFKHLRSTLAAMQPLPAALIVDLFGTEALEMARELGIRGYVFMTTSAWFLSLFLFFPRIDKSVIENHALKHEPLKIPGCRPVQFEDTLESFRYYKEENYQHYAQLSREIRSADGVLSNTWQDLEATSIKALREAEVPVYSVGPLIRSPEPGLNSKVLDWLDKQPNESVIYVSFGSGGTLSPEQTTELAFGLEMSRQRFIWVVRSPVKNDSAGAFFGNESSGDFEYLPDGFRERTGEIGLVVRNWAPQAEILNHGSIGGFMSHCGWNSTIESIVNGVAMIAWPLYAEQKMNGAMLTEELGVGVRLRLTPEKGVVVREEIEKMVRKIMEEREGRMIRERVKKLQNSGKKAVGKGGSSYNSLAQVAGEIEITL